jgi:hypothetical protein
MPCQALIQYGDGVSWHCLLQPLQIWRMYSSSWEQQCRLGWTRGLLLVMSMVTVMMMMMMMMMIPLEVLNKQSPALVNGRLQDVQLSRVAGKLYCVQCECGHLQAEAPPPSSSSSMLGMPPVRCIVHPARHRQHVLNWSCCC